MVEYVVDLQGGTEACRVAKDKGDGGREGADESESIFVSDGEIHDAK